MKLAGKVAIITGAAKGIGKAIALKFAAEGAAVIIADIDMPEAKNVAREIKSQGGTAEAVKVDVCRKDEIQRMVSFTLDKYKKIDILVNNAGITKHALLLDMTEDDWDSVIDVDLKGVFICTQAVLGHMMERRYGKIINHSSIAGTTAGANMANYAPAKAGVDALTKDTAKAAGLYEINVNAIASGSILTDMTYSRRSKEEVKAHVEEKRQGTVIGRNGKPEDVANLALFLASDDSSFITGQVISCDGGRPARM